MQRTPIETALEMPALNSLLWIADSSLRLCGDQHPVASNMF